eukprot:COSAG05_NODE_3734_length_1872_cov_1.697124_3_plen_50_part_01
MCALAKNGIVSQAGVPSRRPDCALVAHCIFIGATPVRHPVTLCMQLFPAR